MIEHAGELLAIHLDPLATQGHEPVLRLHERPPFGVGQRFAVKRHPPTENAQHGIHADTAAAAFAHALRSPSGGFCVRSFPPIRDAGDDAAFLEHGDFAEKGVGLGGRPCLGLKDAAASRAARASTGLDSAAFRIGSSSERSAHLFFVPAYS